MTPKLSIGLDSGIKRVFGIGGIIGRWSSQLMVVEKWFYLERSENFSVQLSLPVFSSQTSTSLRKNNFKTVKDVVYKPSDA